MRSTSASLRSPLLSALAFASLSSLAAISSLADVSPAATTPAPRPAAAPASAPAATTQACLGDLSTFLTCPAGAAVSGTECRQRNTAANEHWSGSSRQGPALFLRGPDNDRLTRTSIISFAATYKNHKKHGRVFRFDEQGRLSSWDNVIDNESFGLSVSCTPQGTVQHLASYFQGKVVGVSRAWRADGTLSYAIDHDRDGKTLAHLTATPELARRPDELCRPARCDVNARPDISGLPAGLTLPAP